MGFDARCCAKVISSRRAPSLVQVSTCPVPSEFCRVLLMMCSDVDRAPNSCTLSGFCSFEFPVCCWHVAFDIALFDLVSLLACFGSGTNCVLSDDA